MTNQDKMLSAYLECALWADAYEVLEGATIFDFDKPSQDQASKDCARFLFHFPQAEGLNPVQLGHDLWLTRNHHGAGFWDRPEIYGNENAEAFTEYAHRLGERWVITNDDGSVGIE